MGHGHEDNTKVLSIHQRISSVLDVNHAERRVFAAVETAVEVDQLEFQLARARMELRAAQERVDALMQQLEDRQP